MFYILISIIFFFFLFLFAKKYFGRFEKRFCVICASVSLTWIFFLMLQFTGFFSDKIILGLLIGSSITGIYYSLERIVKEKLKIFRLPFLLTLLTTGYFLLSLEFETRSILLLLFAWIIFIFSYIYRNNYRFKFFAKKVLECCKNW